MTITPLRITAHLAAPLAGDAPRLDGVLEWASARRQNRGTWIVRDGPPPPLGDLPIGLQRIGVGPWPVARCSDAIVAVPAATTVEHVAKRIAVEYASDLRPDARRIITTTNSWTKSYRLPLLVRTVDRVRWFATGDRETVRNLLCDIKAIGKKVAIGYGRVARWDVEEIAEDWSWFAPALEGLLLMATLPACMSRPAGLIGWRPDFRACCPPYWHLARRTESIVPC